MKKSEFRKELKAIFKEGLMSKLVNPGNGELDKYVGKVDKFIDSAVDDCEKLIEEGGELMEEDAFRLPQVGERNRMILEMIGMLKKFKNDLISIPTQTRQKMG
jgi:hypothetical protein